MTDAAARHAPPASLDALYVALVDGALRFEPLAEAHREPLRAACAGDEDFWPVYPQNFGAAAFDASLDATCAAPNRQPYAIVEQGRCRGMTGYLNVDAASAVVEIGGTYLARDARGTGLNRRCKTLLIDHAIACGFQRIEFRIDARNTRSQAAVAKLGARHEGTLRRQRRLWTGFIRDTQIWSLLAEEWRA